VIEEQWKKLSKMSTGTPKALRLYATYLVEILNDKESGTELMSRAKEAANMRVNLDFNNFNEDFSDIMNYAPDGTPCVYISGETERLGTINQCNMGVCKIFGYTRKDEIINKDVEILMPSIYADNHKKFLNISINKSGDQISSRERAVFGKHYSGYIFPLWLQIKNLPSMLTGRQFVATFKLEKSGINKQIAHVLLSPQKELMDISASTISLLDISLEKLQKRNIYYDVKELLPDLFNTQQTMVYQTKAGGEIQYYYPTLVEAAVQGNAMNDHTNNT